MIYQKINSFVETNFIVPSVEVNPVDRAMKMPLWRAYLLENVYYWKV